MRPFHAVLTDHLVVLFSLERFFRLIGHQKLHEKVSNTFQVLPIFFPGAKAKKIEKKVSILEFFFVFLTLPLENEMKETTSHLQRDHPRFLDYFFHFFEMNDNYRMKRLLAPFPLMFLMM